MLTWDLPDRWTYKWFIVAVSGSSATTTSNIQTFSVYLPAVSTVADGVPLINGMRDLNKDGVIEPYENWHLPIATRVSDLLSRMTLQERGCARAADGLACCLWTSYFHPEYGSLDVLGAIKARAATAGVNVYQDTSPAPPKLAIVAVGEASYTHATNWVKEQPACSSATTPRAGSCPGSSRAAWTRSSHQAARTSSPTPSRTGTFRTTWAPPPLSAPTSGPASTRASPCRPAAEISATNWRDIHAFAWCTTHMVRRA